MVVQASAPVLLPSVLTQLLTACASTPLTAYALCLQGGVSRSCYHGVPLILGESAPAELCAAADTSSRQAVADWLLTHRININVRQAPPSPTCSLLTGGAVSRCQTGPLHSSWIILPPPHARQVYAQPDDDPQGSPVQPQTPADQPAETAAL